MNLSRLSEVLPPGRVLDDPGALRAHSGDESSASPVSPVAVVRAETVDDIVATLKWATSERVPVTPRGAGTGKAGGCIPSAGGIVLSLAAMQRVLSVRPEHGWAEVEPGVVTGEFRDSMEDEFGLFYPPDPASLDTCTLGGNVATNAGGPVATRYGVTGDHVLGVTAVLADGSVIETGRRQPKSVAGYDLSSLLVGSEGTLAIIAGIRLRLRPRPREVVAARIAFDSTRDAADAVVRARITGLEPRALELFDGTTLSRLARHDGADVDPAWGAMLLVEFDGEPGRGEADLRRFVEELRRPPREVRLATSAEDRAAVWQLRRRTSRLVKTDAAGWISQDVAVPLASIPAMLDALERVGGEHDLVAFAYGHAGDGNLHVNLLWDEPGGEERAEAASEDVIRRALDLGGTISGEHGIGLLKRRFLPWELGDRQMELQRRLKESFDPLGILNPGKVF